MNQTAFRLKEKDVRNDSPSLVADEFLRLYLASNFPQTAAYPSEDQKQQKTVMQPQKDTLNYIKKPPSGTSFDRPDRY